ncbi:hypothetical protein M407DRAFT_16600 [Tulasnella calospora MUT 4182]|uniref:Uncharacterized protein n=1 Tax=Tulasnella calospora MUT 4182 TaxID=1051891 RepID=A0A0C3LKH4_9AGAM|nr:hypothetical protein M407DRAFT_16600 [Tulasnella calospora MUT 4182]
MADEDGEPLADDGGIASESEEEESDGGVDEELDSESDEESPEELDEAALEADCLSWSSTAESTAFGFSSAAGGSWPFPGRFFGSPSSASSVPPGFPPRVFIHLGYRRDLDGEANNLEADVVKCGALDGPATAKESERPAPMVLAPNR